MENREKQYPLSQHDQSSYPLTETEAACTELQGSAQEPLSMHYGFQLVFSWDFKMCAFVDLQFLRFPLDSFHFAASLQIILCAFTWSHCIQGLIQLSVQILFCFLGLELFVVVFIVDTFFEKEHKVGWVGEKIWKDLREGKNVIKIHLNKDHFK